VRSAHGTIHRMAAPQSSADRTCPKCGYALKGLSSAVCPECGVEFTPALALRAQRRARRRRWLIAFLVVAIIMYAPHAWLLFIDHPWDEHHWLWMRLWPILPGLPATLLERFVFKVDLPEWGEFVSMGVFTLIALLLFTWIASRGKPALVAVIILVTPPSIYLGLASHSLFRM